MKVEKESFLQSRVEKLQGRRRDNIKVREVDDGRQSSRFGRAEDLRLRHLPSPNLSGPLLVAGNVGKTNDDRSPRRIRLHHTFFDYRYRKGGSFSVDSDG